MCDQKFRCHLFDYLLVIVSGRNELDQYGDPSNEKKIEKSPWEMYICTLNRSLICSLKGGVYLSCAGRCVYWILAVQRPAESAWLLSPGSSQLRGLVCCCAVVVCCSSGHCDL